MNPYTPRILEPLLLLLFSSFAFYLQRKQLPIAYRCLYFHNNVHDTYMYISKQRARLNRLKRLTESREE